MATIIAIQIVLFSAAMAQQQFGDSNLDGLWFHITSAGNPFLPSSQSPCLLRGSPTVKRNDYTYTPGIGAHKVHAKAESWNKAWEICRNEGGYLAILNSYAESQLIVKLLEKARPHTGATHDWLAHIGFHDHFTKNAWVTLQGQSLQEAGFNDWYEGEPNNAGGQERCGGAYISDGRLNDQDCEGYKCVYICELPYIEP